MSTLHWPPHLRQSYHNSENFSTMWSPSHSLHSSTSSSTTRDAPDFSTYTWLKLAPVCADIFPTMIILCGCWSTFIRFWKSSTHSWGQLELRLDWKVNSITSCARGGWRMKGTWWRSQRAEILNYDNFGLGRVDREGERWRCDCIQSLILQFFLQHPT